MGKVKKLWHIPPENRKKDGKGIEADFWEGFYGFLTNGGDGVVVTLAQEAFGRKIKAGDVIIFDSNLAPKTRDTIVVEIEGEWRVRKFSPSLKLIGVVIAIVNLTEAHRRQREG